MSRAGKIILGILIAGLLSACATTSNKIVKVETPEMPLLRAALYFPFGSGIEKDGEEGATLLLTRWMDFGSQRRSMEDFGKASLSLGAAIETTVNPRYTLVTVEAPVSQFMKAWELALEKVRTPKLAPADLETVRAGVISAKKSRLMTWSTAGRQLGTAVLYSGKPEAHSEFGTEQALNSLNAEQLQKHYSTTFARGPAVVLVSQSVSADMESAMRKSVDGWTVAFQKVKSEPVSRKGRHLLIVERPGSSQAYLFFVKAGPIPGTDEHALTSIGTQLLGSNGGNSSILYDELRAQRGLTYHASMQTAKNPNKQTLFGVTFGANENIGELASLYLSEWQKFYNRNDIPEADLQEAFVAYQALRDRETETLADLIRSAAETMSVTGETKSIWAQPKIDQRAYNQAKAKWLALDDFTLLVLGDSSKIKESLEKALGSVRSTKVLPADSDWDAVSKAVTP